MRVAPSTNLLSQCRRVFFHIAEYRALLREVQMCGCDEEDAAERDVIDFEILEKARSRERNLTGERVPAEAWDIFAGKAGGGVVWAHYQRMQSCYSSTAELAKSMAHMKRERRFPRKIKCSPAAV